MMLRSAIRCVSRSTVSAKSLRVSRMAMQQPSTRCYSSTFAPAASMMVARFAMPRATAFSGLRAKPVSPFSGVALARYYAAEASTTEPAASPRSYLDKAEVTERILRVVKNFEKVDPAKVTPTSHFANDLKLDSLDQVEIVLAVEQEFAMEIPDKEAEKIFSVEDAISYICASPLAK